MSRPPRRRARRPPARFGAGPSGTQARPTGAPGLGGGQVEGRHAVRELLAAGRRRTREVWMAEGRADSAALAEIADLADAARVRLRRVAPERLLAAAQTEAPQGVLARADPLPEADLDELARGARPFLVVLDGVTDPHNLGAVLRTAECAGATGAVLPRHRAVRITPAAAKAAAGAVERLPLALVPGIPNGLAALREAGVWTVGLDMGAERSLFDLPVGAEPVALVLGGEGRGLGRLARERCDLVVSIPLRGALESLNVAAAAAVACYEVVRTRGL